MTFSKPLAPGLKTGYGFLPRELVAPVLRLKGNHDFGSGNLVQHMVHRVLETGDYDRHVDELCEVYRNKRDVLLQMLTEQFAHQDCMSWTEPAGGMYVWLTFPPDFDAGAKSAFMKQCLQEGVLYVPGQFCYVTEGGRSVPSNEARLCYGVASPDQLREATLRLARAFDQVNVEAAAVS